MTAVNWDYESRLPAGVAEHLGYYVYLYVDPRTGEPFYVGKGVGERVLAHFGDVKDSEKTRLIAELRNAGMNPRLEILAHGLRDEETAFRVEAAVIDVLGLERSQIRLVDGVAFRLGGCHWTIWWGFMLRSLPRLSTQHLLSESTSCSDAA